MKTVIEWKWGVPYIILTEMKVMPAIWGGTMFLMPLIAEPKIIDAVHKELYGVGLDEWNEDGRHELHYQSIQDEYGTEDEPMFFKMPDKVATPPTIAGQG